MEFTNSALRAELGATLKLLQQSARELSTHIQQHARDAWVWSPGGSDASAFSRPALEVSRELTLQRIAEGIEDIKYDDGQDSHESRIYPGIVAVSRGGIALADEVNRAKRALADVLKQMDGRTEMAVIDQQTGERGLRPLREVALRAFFFRRLHHWQATRRLEVLRESDEIFGIPEYIGFMWTNLRVVRKTTSTDLIAQARAPGARLMSEPDIEVLERLPAGEPLALVRQGKIAPKANVRFARRDEKRAVSRVYMAVLPLIILGDQLPTRLRKLPPAPTPKHFRLGRVDVEIESTPLLKTLPVYRYLESFRESKR